MKKRRRSRNLHCASRQSSLGEQNSCCSPRFSPLVFEILFCRETWWKRNISFDSQIYELAREGCVAVFWFVSILKRYFRLKILWHVTLALITFNRRSTAGIKVSPGQIYFTGFFYCFKLTFTNEYIIYFFNFLLSVTPKIITQIHIFFQFDSFLKVIFFNLLCPGRVLNALLFLQYKWKDNLSLDDTLLHQQRDLPLNLSYNMDIMQQTACMAVNKAWLVTLLLSLIARSWVDPRT